MKERNKIYRMVMPVTGMNGFQSTISPHFGKAPGFMVVNSDGGALVYLKSDTVRGAGECAPISAMVEAGAEVVVAQGMGRGALQRCRDNGLQVVSSGGETVLEVLDALRLGKCRDFADDFLCDHHGDNGLCH